VESQGPTGSATERVLYLGDEQVRSSRVLATSAVGLFSNVEAGQVTRIAEFERENIPTVGAWDDGIEQQ
jgi:hypothetical protein